MTPTTCFIKATTVAMTGKRSKRAMVLSGTPLLIRELTKKDMKFHGLSLPLCDVIISCGYAFSFKVLMNSWSFILSIRRSIAPSFARMMFFGLMRSNWRSVLLV